MNEAATRLIQERRGMPRFHLLSRVDVSVPGKGDTYWGSLANISRTGLTAHIRQHLKLQSRVMVCFRFMNGDGREVTEALSAKVIWQSGNNAGLEFETPLTAGSTALLQAPFLVAHLVMKEA